MSIIDRAYLWLAWWKLRNLCAEVIERYPEETVEDFRFRGFNRNNPHSPDSDDDFQFWINVQKQSSGDISDLEEAYVHVLREIWQMLFNRWGEDLGTVLVSPRGALKLRLPGIYIYSAKDDSVLFMYQIKK